MNATDLDELDRMLSAEEVITPSSGFAAGVMEAVGEAASEPPPLPFPWRRFAAGLLGCAIWSASAIALVELVDWSVLSQSAVQLAAAPPEPGYAAALLGLTLAFLRVQRTFARA